MPAVVSPQGADDFLQLASETIKHARYLCKKFVLTPICDFVVSFNERHLRPAREFGIEVIRPVDLLRLIGEIK